MRHLDDGQFHATFAHKMQEVALDPAILADVLRAVGEIRGDHMDGFALDRILVEYVYRCDSGLFEHYLIPTTTKNVYLVLVRDRVQESFYGYRVLNLNTKYGLPTPKASGTTRG